MTGEDGTAVTGEPQSGIGDEEEPQSVAGNESTAPGNEDNNTTDNSTTDNSTTDNSTSDDVGNVLNQPQKNADGSYVLTDFEDEAIVNIKIPDGFKEDYMDNTYFAMSKEPADEDDNYISATYTIIGLNEYYSEDDYVENYLAQQDNYEEYGYKTFKCDGPGSLSLDGKTISYITIEYSFGEDSDNRQLVFWTKIDDEHLLECSVAENVFNGTASVKADEETAKMMFSGVSYDEGTGL